MSIRVVRWPPDQSFFLPRQLVGGWYGTDGRPLNKERDDERERRERDEGAPTTKVGCPTSEMKPGQKDLLLPRVLPLFIREDQRV